MGLEKLQSIFNKIDDNQADLHDGLPMESIDNRLFDYELGLIKIHSMTNEQTPSPLMAITNINSDSIVGGHSANTIRVNYQGGQLQTQIDLSNKENYPYKDFTNPFDSDIMEVEPDVTPLDLGKGDLRLESLFDPTHGTGTPDRIPFMETHKLQSDLQLHATPKGKGSLDIRSTKGYGGRFGNLPLFKGNEPYIVKPIGAVGRNEKARGYDRDFLPYNAAKDDLIRFGNYYTSTDGLAFMLKENLTNLAIGDGFTLANPFRSVLAPPVPIPMTGFINFYQQKLQGLGRGSIRKPAMKEYSKLANVRGEAQELLDAMGATSPDLAKMPILVLKVQGDGSNPIKPDVSPLLKYVTATRGEKRKKREELRAEYMKEGRFDEGNTGPAFAPTAPSPQSGLQKVGSAMADAASWALVKAKNLAIKQVIKQVIKLEHLPPMEQPARRFLDLRGGGVDHKDPEKGYVDNFSNEKSLLSGLTYEPPLESSGDVDPGDFYVRIRDLRTNKYIYFRGYVTGITENVSPSWNQITYLGRSQDIYNYQKAERDLSFNLKVAPQNQREFDTMYDKINDLTSLAYPEYHSDVGAFRMKAPFTELYLAHIGSKVQGQFGFIKSLTYTVNESGDWDALSSLPRVFDIAINYQILNRKAPQLDHDFYRLPARGA